MRLAARATITAQHGTVSQQARDPIIPATSTANAQPKDTLGVTNVLPQSSETKSQLLSVVEIAS
jgi:hypothetical protein